MTPQEQLRDVTQKLHEATRELREANDRTEKQREESQAVSQETRDKLDAANLAITELKEEQKTIIAKMNRPGIPAADDLPPEKRKERFIYEKFIRYGNGDDCKVEWKPEERSTLSRLLSVRKEPLADEFRSLIGASDVTGQFLVPTDFENDIIMQAYDLAALRQYANARSTSRDTVEIPALKKPVFGWGRQSVAVTAQTMATGVERLPINEVTGLMLIANNTLEDADADIFGELADAFGPGLAEVEDDAFCAGVGDDSPQGIVSNTSVQANYTATGVAAAISDGTHNGIDPLITAMGALKSTYRQTAVWGMNSVTEALYRKLKDGNGRYLWEPNVQEGKPPTLLGRPVINPEGMPAVAANAYPVFFGSLQRGYRIRDRKGISIQRLIERYSEYRQTGFLVTKRVGGQVTLPEAFRVIKVAAS